MHGFFYNKQKCLKCVHNLRGEVIDDFVYFHLFLRWPREMAKLYYNSLHSQWGFSDCAMPNAWWEQEVRKSDERCFKQNTNN